MNENQTPLNTAGGNEITLWSILRLLISKLFLLLLAGVAVGLAVFLVLNFLVTPKYESRVSFYVYNSADSASHVGTINNNDLQAAESLAAQVDIFGISTTSFNTIINLKFRKINIF